MAGNRYGLLMGSVKSIDGVNLPINDKIVAAQLDSFKKTLTSSLGSGEYSFSWFNSDSSELIRTPTPGTFLNKLEEFSTENVKITKDDIFLFYYFGHGFVDKDRNLCLGFNSLNIADDRTYQFSINRICEEIINQGFKKIILILDCCYAGIKMGDLNFDNVDIYLLAASYNNYSKFNSSGGEFSQSLIRVLNDPLIENYIQPGSDEFTLHDLFTGCTTFVNGQTPTSSGNLAHVALKPHDFSKFISPAFNKKSSLQSVYHKLFVLMSEVINTNAYPVKSIHKDILKKRLASFKLINNVGSNQEVYVSINMITEYMQILLNLGFAKQNQNNNWLLTNNGLSAIRNDGLRFNELLIVALFNWLEQRKLSAEERIQVWKKVRETFKTLISTYSIPNLTNFDKKFFLENRTVSKNELKIILQLLSFTEVLKRVDIHTYFI